MNDGIQDLNILVVDDALVDRMKLVLALKALGHDVSEASSGQAALDALRDGHFDGVMLDLLMPDMDGFDTLEQMPRAHGKLETCTVVVSSLEDEAQLRRALELGATDHLRKPFGQADLVRVLSCFC